VGRKAVKPRNADKPETGRRALLTSCPPGPSLLLVALLVLAAFAVSLANGFVWDDHLIVVPTPAYRNFDLTAIFLSKANGLEYLPIRDVTLALDAAVWGVNPFGFHLSNLLLYLLSLPLAYGVVQRLAGLCRAGQPNRIAFVTTLVFALHPLHAEAVNFVSARNNILAMLFLLLSLYLFIGGKRQTALSLALSVFAFLLAILSKASAVFYPLFLLGLVILVPSVRPRGYALWLALLAFLAIDAVGIVIHLNTAMDTGVANRDVWRFGNESIPWLLFKVSQIPLFYFQKLLLAYPLSAVYPEDFLSAHYGLRAAAGCAAVSILLAWGWWLRRRSLLPLLGVLWLLVSLVPVSNIFPTSPVVADRYAYPAVFGFGLLCAYLVEVIADNNRGWLALAGIVPLFWVAIDLERSFAWRSDLTLMAAAYAVYPQWARADYATALLREGQGDEALAVFAQEDPPGFRHSHTKGRLLMEQGKVAQAIPYLKRSLALGGNTERYVHLDLAKSYEQIGNPMSALEHYLAARDAPSLDALNRYRAAAEAGIRRARKQFAARRAALHGRATERSRDFRMQFEFALFLHSTGEYEEAARYYARANAIDSSHWEAWYNQGLAYAKQRDHGEAIKAFHKALDGKPNHPDTFNHLGIAHAALGEDQVAIDYYRRALEADDSFEEAAFNLGRYYFHKGDRGRSRHYFRLARELAGDNPELIAQINYALGRMQ